MMVEMMQPTPDDVICDPACGTSGFLVTAGDYFKEKHKEEIFYNKIKKDHYMNHMFFGYDMDRTMLRIGAMNMMTHGVESPFIEYRDSLSDQNTDKGKYSLILANPPFKGSLDYDTVSADLLKVCKTKKTELLFLALFLRMLKIGGRCACIVPDGVLFGSSTAHKAIRKEIIENNRLEAIISMPSGVFKPYAGVSTAVMVFTKTGHDDTDKVWFYDMKADGLSLDDKRSPVADNDIPDIVARFHNLAEEENRQRTEQSFFVPKDEIVANGYDLSINKYKKTEYVAVEYAPTSQILAELNEFEVEIQKSLKGLNDKIQPSENFDISQCEYRPLGSICEVITKGTTPTTNGFGFVNQGINFIKIESINDDKTINPQKLSHISMDCHKTLKRSVLRNGDILFSIAGAIGKIALVDEKILPANTNQALAIIRLTKSEPILNFYLAEILDSDIVKKQYEEKIRGVAQANLSLKDVSDLTIPIPSIDMQRKFVDFVNYTNQLKSEIKKSLEKLETLKKALMQKYFG